LRLAAAQCGKAPPFRAWAFIFPEAQPQEELVRAGRKAKGFPHCAAASRKKLLEDLSRKQDENRFIVSASVKLFASARNGRSVSPGRSIAPQ
jgi:hypothetical protein